MVVFDLRQERTLFSKDNMKKDPDLQKKKKYDLGSCLSIITLNISICVCVQKDVAHVPLNQEYVGSN